ncbi:MAG: hypothetical protein H2049_00495 [Porphyrobacter sp.]|nr:hypothetical protein [Porphyrobacter sp.]
MSQHGQYLDTALEAAAMVNKGKTRFEVKDALGLRYVGEADTLIRTGKRHIRTAGYALTPDEMTLLHALARAERAKTEVGDLSTCKLKHVTPWLWSRSKCERIARKRLDLHATGVEELTPLREFKGLGLIEVYHGGYIRMRPAGWALIHALEAMGDAT